jgi:hypothetical protein
MHFYTKISPQTVGQDAILRGGCQPPLFHTLVISIEIG